MYKKGDECSTDVFMQYFPRHFLPQKFSIKLSVICTQSIIYLVHFARFVKTFVWILMPSLIRNATLCSYVPALFYAINYMTWKVYLLFFSWVKKVKKRNTKINFSSLIKLFSDSCERKQEICQMFFYIM